MLKIRQIIFKRSKATVLSTATVARKKKDESRQSGTDPPKKVEERKKEEQKKLDKAVKESDRILYRLKGFWPFDFFQDELIICRSEINLVCREFFLSQEVQAVSIEDITDIRLERGPLFATLRIMKMSFVNSELEIGYLRVGQAIKARQIIQGLMIVRERKIDVSIFSKDELLGKLREIGSSQVKE